MREMSEKAKKARNLYMKQWKEKNREKQLAYQNTYWERKAEGVIKNAR